MEFIINKHYMRLVKSLFTTLLVIAFTTALYMYGHKGMFITSWFASLACIFLLFSQAINLDTISEMEKKIRNYED